MLRDRYDPMALFALIPRLSLAMGPVLAQLNRLLDDDMRFQRVQADLCRRAAHTPTRGCLSTPVQVILRMLVVMRWYGWSYEETRTSLPIAWCCGSSAGATWTLYPMIPPCCTGSI
jgi:IS5 family transposase